MKITQKKDDPVSKSLTIVLGATAAVATGAMATGNVAHADTIKAKEDTKLRDIAKENHVDLDDLAKANKMDKNDQVKKDEEIDIPDTYTVKKGDTVSGIAQKLDIDTQKLLDKNNLTWQNATIKVDEKLKLPDKDDDKKNTQSQEKTTQQASTQSTQATTTAQAPNAGSVVGNAKQLASMGIPYVYGGTSLSGFDCSGLVQYVEAQSGVSVGRDTIAQAAQTTKKPVSQAQPGDLVFWGSESAPYHVGIYIGNGQYVHSPAPGQSVTIGSVAAYAPSFAGTIN